MRIPRWLVAAWDAFGDWANVAVYVRDRIEIRRIDLLLGFMGVAVPVYYWLVDGWLAALIGALTYSLMLMLALWIL